MLISGTLTSENMKKSVSLLTFWLPYKLPLAKTWAKYCMLEISNLGVDITV